MSSTTRRRERAAIIAKCPAHEREAQTKGIPTLGSGRIFPLADEDVQYDAAQTTLPDHWPRIAGIDFGWDHLRRLSGWHGTATRTRSMCTTCHRQKERNARGSRAAAKRQGEWMRFAGRFFTLEDPPHCHPPHGSRHR
jgi:hypothetical protein